MNFAVLAVLLVVLLRKPISQTLNGRIKGIKDQLEDLEKKKKEAERQLVEYNERLTHLDKEADRIVAEYVKQGNDAKARILQEAKASAKKIEEQARKTIAHEFDRAKEQLQAEVLERALAKAEDIIKGNITSTDQDRLVDEYLEKVELQ
jgi:F-type H+-transporting ATPase subunit b